MAELVAISVDEARAICRLVYDTIDDLSEMEAAAVNALANRCGYDEWRAELIAEGRARMKAENDAMFIILGLWVFATGGVDLDVVPA